MERTRTTRWSRRGTAALLAAIALVVSACGSDTTANAPAGAKENAVGDAVCYDWPAGTVAKPCAINLKGPGGGRIFYDAGTTQPWGRFLEVAPQNWNPTLGGKLYECPGSGLTGSTCGSADEAKWPKSTGDFGQPDDPAKTGQVGNGYHLCNPGDGGVLWTWQPQPLDDLGTGRANTDALYANAECYKGSDGAVKLAKEYRGGGLADWYVPSYDELLELCNYGKRDGIGGFPSKKHYVSSSATPEMRGGPVGGFYQFPFRRIEFDTCTEQTGDESRGQARLVRPIRAF
jgi:hypothetical protein